MATSDAAVVDLRRGLRQVGDQGWRGTCVAFAVTSAHEHHANNGQLVEPDDLSEETLYWGCKQLDGVQGPGTRLTAADLALQRWGQPIEALWPYDDGRDDRAVDYRPPPEAIRAENCCRASLRALRPTLPDIRAHLDGGLPVVAAMRIWEEFRHPTVEPLPAPTRSQLFPTGHAVLVVGYDTRRAALLVRNSWGANWGINGYLWVADAVVPFLLGAWVVAGETAAGVLAGAGNVILAEGRHEPGARPAS